MHQRSFSEKVIKWYEENKRDLPWRHTSDPYKIWLSEVILQQTRVDQGLPYYHNFVEEFPTVYDLAAASEEKVLRAWQGLGYYSRARNLHACAKEIAQNRQGKFPNTSSELKKLPGIGPYTASAIASIAFKEPVAVVDGNVYRVLSRVFGIKEDILSTSAKKTFQKVADDLIDEKCPDLFNQGMMEFGALHCTPANPNCQSCPFNVECHARIHHAQSELPVKKKKKRARTRYFHYIVLEYMGKILMKQRGPGDIWQGLYDFPVVEINDPDRSPNQLTIDNVVVESKACDVSESYKHILSHQHLITKFYRSNISEYQYNNLHEKGHQWYTEEEILELPKPVLISAYLNEVIF